MKYKIENFTISFYFGQLTVNLPIDVIFDPFLELKIDYSSLKYIYQYIDELNKIFLDRNLNYSDIKTKYENRILVLWERILIKILSASLNENDEVFLYFMQNENGLIKIGISKDPENRRKQLQSILKEKIFILKVLKFPEYERLLHKKFFNYNAFHRGQVEWFTPYPDLVEFIDKVDDDSFEKHYKKIKLKYAQEQRI